MNINAAPIQKYSKASIDRDALCRAFNVPRGVDMTDRTINLWLAQNVAGMTDYQTPDTLDMDLLRKCLANGRDASIEAINESLAVTADALDGGSAQTDAAASPVVPRNTAAPAIIGLSASALTFRDEVAARLRKAGF